MAASAPPRKHCEISVLRSRGFPSRASRCPSALGSRAMTSVMAIVSKALFDKAIKGKAAIGPGKVLDFDRYVSTNKNLEQLSTSGALFMVTVRPPDERLWLVAILESPSFDGEQWIGKPNAAPIADITDLIPRLEFTSGKGIKATKGALGMSLQTPRGLTDEDIGLLRTAVAS